MKPKPATKSKRKAKAPDEIWKLRLYVSDRTLKSVTAFTNLSRICHEHLAGKCRIAVIDIEKSPRLAKESQIVAIPTPVKTFPLPMRTMGGDLSNTNRVLVGLDIRPAIENEVRITHLLHRKAVETEKGGRNESQF